MGMTEKQGGSDVLSNTTRAEKTAEGFYRLVGHKWFFSVPQSDAHLVLAQAPAGLSCFFVPRLLPDGQRALAAATQPPNDSEDPPAQDMERAQALAQRLDQALGADGQLF